MKVTKTVAGSVSVLTLTGILDARAADTTEADLLSAMPANASLLVDLSEVTHVTSAGLRTLLLFYRQGRCLETSVALVGLSPELRNVLWASGYLAFFEVARSVAEGMELLRRSAEAPVVGPASDVPVIDQDRLTMSAHV